MDCKSIIKQMLTVLALCLPVYLWGQSIDPGGTVSISAYNSNPYPPVLLDAVKNVNFWELQLRCQSQFAPVEWIFDDLFSVTGELYPCEVSELTIRDWGSAKYEASLNFQSCKELRTGLVFVCRAVTDHLDNILVTLEPNNSTGLIHVVQNRSAGEILTEDIRKSSSDNTSACVRFTVARMADGGSSVWRCEGQRVHVYLNLTVLIRTQSRSKNSTRKIHTTMVRNRRLHKANALCVAAAVITLALFTSSTASVPLAKTLAWWKNPGNGNHVPIFRDGYRSLAAKANPAEDMSKCKFYLFTRNNPTTGQELIAGSLDSITRSNWIRGAPVKVLAHGFLSRIETDYPWLARQAYLSLGQDVNIILVDWQWLANGPFYDLAATNTKPVGEKTADLLAYLLQQGFATIDQIHMQGMSLGSHVAGSAGAHLTRLTGGLKIPRITGNDPAGPLFEDELAEWRLDPTDAVFVDAVHTDGERLGFGITLVSGHVDFYPNGGESQPGCITDVCDHARAVSYNAESITSAVMFKACKCDSWAQYTGGNCGCQVTANMGEPCSSSAQHGKYYLRTNSKSPYAQG